MTLVKVLLLLILSAFSIDAANAAPDVAVPPARLEIRAPSRCTTLGELKARVAARSPRVQFTDDAALTAQATFTTPRPGAVVADLVLAGPGSKPSSRRLVARTCADAVDAVALIIAVTLDPAASKTGRPTTAAESESRGEPVPPVAAASTSTSRPAPAPTPSAPKRTEAPAAIEPLPPKRTEADVKADLDTKVKDSASRASLADSRLRFGAHLSGQTIFGPAPSFMPGVSLYTIAVLERQTLWSPALLVGVSHVGRSGLAKPGGTASFTLDAASVDACPLRLSVATLEARACAAVLLGRMTADGSDTENEATSRRMFMVTGASAVLTTGLGSVFEVVARLGMGVTLVRDSYAFSSSVFHQADRLTTSASLGIGIRLPR
jgi:hypothetical protein